MYNTCYDQKLDTLTSVLLHYTLYISYVGFKLSTTFHLLKRLITVYIVLQTCQASRSR